MDLKAFVCCQRWAAVDEVVTAEYDALVAAGKDGPGAKALVPLITGDTVLYGGFHIGDQSFCAFAPEDGDQAQFKCQLYLYRAPDANRIMIVALYMRMYDKMYWIDHQCIRKITKPVEDVDLASPVAKRPRSSRLVTSTPPSVNDPATIPFLVLDFGAVCLRLWIERAGMTPSTQAKRLLQATRLMESYLPAESIDPSSYETPIVSPTPEQLIGKLNALLTSMLQAPEEIETQMQSIKALAEKNGIDLASPAPIQSNKLGELLGAIVANMHGWTFERVMQLATLDFTPCTQHEECFYLSQDSKCSSTMWRNWEQVLSAEQKDRNVVESDASFNEEASMNQLAQDMTASSASRALKKSWMHQSMHHQAILDACESTLVGGWFPKEISHSKPSDDVIARTKSHFNTIRDLRKKNWETELSVLLL